METCSLVGSQSASGIQAVRGLVRCSAGSPLVLAVSRQLVSRVLFCPSVIGPQCRTNHRNDDYRQYRLLQPALENRNIYDAGTPGKLRWRWQSGRWMVTHWRAASSTTVSCSPKVSSARGKWPCPDVFSIHSCASTLSLRRSRWRSHGEQCVSLF